jgi:malate/lactate dehydrogenase
VTLELVCSYSRESDCLIYFLCLGGIGQPLSLLLKTCPLVDELSLYDIVNSPGVAADLSHINTKSVVTGYLPPDDGMAKSLIGADIVVIPAGVPRKVPPLHTLKLIASLE